MQVTVATARGGAALVRIRVPLPASRDTLRKRGATCLLSISTPPSVMRSVAET